MLLGMYGCMYSKVRRVSEFVLYEMGIYTNEEKGKKKEKTRKTWMRLQPSHASVGAGCNWAGREAKALAHGSGLEKKVQVKDGLTAFASALWRLCLKGRDERGFCDSELGAKKRG